MLNFTTVAVAFGFLMFLAYATDVAIGGSAPVERIDNALLRWKANIDAILRAAIGAFFVSLWTSGGIILTPEFKTSSGIVPWNQLAIALSMLFRPTSLLGCGRNHWAVCLWHRPLWRLPHDGLSDLSWSCRIPGVHRGARSDVA